MTGKIDLASFTHFWTIDSFSTLLNEGVQKSLLSPVFPINEHIGYIRLGLNEPTDLYHKDFISLWFFINESIGEKIGISYKFSILSSEKTEVPFVQDKIFLTNAFGCGCARFISKDTLMNTLKKYLLPNDKLTIISKITVHKQTAAVQFDECSKELKDLFENKQFTDITLVVDDQKIEVHKAILASKSSVFYAMFNHDTKESTENSVKIVDIDYNVVLELVRFIYTGNVKNLENLSKDLLITADKYQISELKDMCEICIAQTVNLENAAELFVFADTYNSSYLKFHLQTLVDVKKKRIY